ncbi:hypothetical protein SAMN03159473_03658 [Pseudomonas sp. NFACC52]|nr:hypothetical protein SAMN03159481_01077 [Pseudomonas sp. NFACC56-3]SFK74489.1 hypothetical protein SAMN03159473_03658 [Pseudomonas sp. NFACC52]
MHRHREHAPSGVRLRIDPFQKVAPLRSALASQTVSQEKGALGEISAPLGHGLRMTASFLKAVGAALARVSEPLDQHVRQHPYLSRGVLALGANNVNASRHGGIPEHYGYQRARFDVLVDDAIRKIPKTQASNGCRGERDRIVSLEAPLGIDHDELFAVHETPGFRTLHKRFMFKKLVGGLRRSMCFHIVRARYEFAVNAAHTLCDEIGTL